MFKSLVATSLAASSLAIQLSIQYEFDYPLVTLEGTDYFIVDYVKSDLPAQNMWFSQATRACEERGAQLASVHNADEQAQVTELAVSHGGAQFWLGAKEVNAAKDFGWLDGTEWSYTNWQARQPHEIEIDDQECLVMRKDNDYEWFDQECEETRSSNKWPICKYAYVEPTPVEPTPVVPTQCPATTPIVNTVPSLLTVGTTFTMGMTQPTEKTYFYPDQTNRSWNESQAVCENLGGQLPVLTNDADLAAFHTARGSQEAFLGMSKVGDTWQWIDGTLLDMSTFQSGQPDGNGPCGRTMGGWDDVPCDNTWDFIFTMCEHDCSPSIDFGGKPDFVTYSNGVLTVAPTASEYGQDYSFDMWQTSANGDVSTTTVSFAVGPQPNVNTPF